MGFSRLTALCLTLMLFTFCGCGGEPITSVDGSLKFKGNPIANVRVNLMDDSGKVWFAKTDASGNFAGFMPGQGVPPGDYTVTLLVEQEVSSNVDDANAYKVNKQKLPYPQKYATKNTSDLQVTIEAKSSQTLTLELNE